MCRQASDFWALIDFDLDPLWQLKRRLGALLLLNSMLLVVFMLLYYHLPANAAVKQPWRS